MVTPRRTPVPAPTPDPADELLPPAGESQVPAKVSKLSAVMVSVKEHMTAMEALGATIDKVEKEYPKNHVFAVATKEGYKLADKVRADARKSRLHVANMRKDGTGLLNNLKEELWAVADPQIARLQAIEDNAKAQVEAQDKKEESRVSAHEANISAIVALAEGVATMTPSEVTARIESLNALIVDDSYEEFEPAALRKKGEVASVLADAHVAAVQRDEDAKQAAQDAARRAEVAQRIEAIRLVPSQVEGTGVENITAIMNQWAAKLDADDGFPAADYGDQVDAAMGAALKTVNALRKLVADLTPAATAAPTPAPAPSSTPQADPDPFEGVPSAPAPRPRGTGFVSRAPVPTAAPAAEELSIEPESVGVDMGAGDEMGTDLIGAAHRMCRAVAACLDTNGRFSALLMTTNDRADELEAAYRELHATVSIVDEFAD